MVGNRTLLLPLAFALGLASLAFLDPVRQNPKVLWAFLGAAAALCAWNAVLFVWSQQRRADAHAGGGPEETALPASLRARLGAAVLGLVLASGLRFCAVYPRPIALRVRVRHVARVGRGAIPTLSASVRFRSSSASTLFLWFKPDWFYLQFAMVALGLAAKELIRWNRDGRRVHIFNPSSFPLAVFSLVLLATGTSDITWGQNIASTQFYPPHMYLVLFLIGLPGQFFFGVTSMTMSAVVSTYAVRPPLLRRDGHLFFLRFVYSDRRLPGDASAV